MENIIIVSNNQKTGEALIKFFNEYFRCNIKFFQSAYQTKNLLEMNFSCELAVIDTPLLDENGLQLAEYISENTTALCILIVKAEYEEKINDFAEKNGIILITKPLSKSVLYRTVKIIEAAVTRLYSLQERNSNLEKKITEIQTEDKAKFMLMQYRNITEDEAHEFIQQYSMNRHMKKSVAANEIIDKITEHYL